MLSAGIIEKVEGTPQWISSVRWTAKSDGSARPAIDYTKVNQSLLRRPVHFPGPDALLKKIENGTKYFLTADFVSGFHQIPLTQESRHLTTFMCEEGLFQFTVLPMGLNTSGDDFNHCTDTLLAEHQKHSLKLIDDLLLMSGTKKS